MYKDQACESAVWRRVHEQYSSRQALYIVDTAVNVENTANKRTAGDRQLARDIQSSLGRRCDFSPGEQLTS